jgi:hypothetical protein
LREFRFELVEQGVNGLKNLALRVKAFE